MASLVVFEQPRLFAREPTAAQLPGLPRGPVNKQFGFEYPALESHAQANLPLVRLVGHNTQSEWTLSGEPPARLNPVERLLDLKVLKREHPRSTRPVDTPGRYAIVGYGIVQASSDLAMEQPTGREGKAVLALETVVIGRALEQESAGVPLERVAPERLPNVRDNRLGRVLVVFPSVRERAERRREQRATEKRSIH